MSKKKKKRVAIPADGKMRKRAHEEIQKWQPLKEV